MRKQSWHMRRLWARLLTGLAAPALLTVGVAAMAAPPPGETVPPPTAVEAAPASLAELRQLAFHKQPALAAYRASVEAAQAKARGLDSLVLPALVRRDLSVRRKQAQFGILAAQAQLLQAEMSTRYSVTRTYLSAAYAQQQLRVADGVLGKAEDITSLAYLRKLAESTYQGDGTRRDVKKWHVDQIDVLIDITRGRSEEAREGVDRARAGIREAVGLSPNCPIPIGEEFTATTVEVPDLPTIIALALARRGEVIQANVGVEVTCLEVEAQGLIFGWTAQTFASASDLHAQPIPQGIANEEYRPGAVSIEMPANLVGHRSARAEQARALHARAQAVLGKTRNLVALEAEDTYRRWQEARNQVEAYRKALKEAEAVADRVRTDFRPGRPAENQRPNFDDLVQTRVRATQLKLLVNKAQYELLLTLIALERITAGGYCPFHSLVPVPAGQPDGGMETQGVSHQGTRAR
jgi:outer membrane protein, heavy metal efflux system